MNLPNTLKRGRAAFARRMRASCRIVVIGPEVTDPTSGVVGRPETTIFEGPCYTRYPGIAFEADHKVGGMRVVDSRILVRVHHSAPMIPVDAVVIMLTDPDNPNMIGVRLQVASIDEQSQATAQRLLCNDTQKGPADG